MCGDSKHTSPITTFHLHIDSVWSNLIVAVSRVHTSQELGDSSRCGCILHARKRERGREGKIKTATAMVGRLISQ